MIFLESKSDRAQAWGRGAGFYQERSQAKGRAVITKMAAGCLGPSLVTAPWYCTISPSQVFLRDPDNEMRKNLIISSRVEVLGPKELLGFLAV